MKFNIKKSIISTVVMLLITQVFFVYSIKILSYYLNFKFYNFYVFANLKNNFPKEQYEILVFNYFDIVTELYLLEILSLVIFVLAIFISRNRFEKIEIILIVIWSTIILLFHIIDYRSPTFIYILFDKSHFYQRAYLGIFGFILLLISIGVYTISLKLGNQKYNVKA